MTVENKSKICKMHKNRRTQMCNDDFESERMVYAMHKNGRIEVLSAKMTVKNASKV